MPSLLAVPEPLLAELRATFAAAGYTGDAIREALGTEARVFDRDDAPVHAHRLRNPDRLSTLIRLFYLCQPVVRDEAEAALAPLSVAELERRGLASQQSGIARALVQLMPARSLLVAGDVAPAGAAPADVVLAASPTSAILASLTMRVPATTALDVGCGSGIQALLAAEHSEQVLAVDTNERAVAYTEFNARLNGVTNVEAARGRWFEPARGRHFALVVSNPPFVVSPDLAFAYRDSDAEGDMVSRLVVAGTADHLEEGGFGIVLCQWARRDGSEPWNPVSDWVAETGCDAWILHFGTSDPISYAAEWNRPLRFADPAAFDATLERWLAYYRRESIEGLSFGAVVLRRRSTGRRWVRTASLPGAPLDPAGDDVRRLFDAQDYLTRFPADEPLLDQAFSLLAPHIVDQALTYEETAYRVEPAGVRAASGLPREVSVDASLVQVLLRLDGEQPLAVAIREAAAALGTDEASLAASALPAMRELVALGLVLPVTS